MGEATKLITVESVSVFCDQRMTAVVHPCVISPSLQQGFTLISMVTTRTSTDAELNLYVFPPAVLSLRTWLSEVTHTMLKIQQDHVGCI